MKVRPYTINDTEEILNLFYDTVHQINIRDYTQEQVNAWATVIHDRELWMNRFNNSFTFVVEKEAKILGFANLENTGYIDCFYVHKDFQGQRVGSILLETIELKVKFLGVNKLFTEASITAKPFFEGKNFVVLKQQEVERRGQKFINFLMEKVFI
ncbi:GNAT family N-acetyltransferase [Anabaena azotica]|uniref:GNAT family N-acetyltransferase n=1 Tax=Anabaena azotica TaxID=197653 RepID=UPI0039A455E5